MRIFKITPKTTEGSENWVKFLHEIEKRINDDAEIIERAQACNRKFAKLVQEIMAGSDNTLYAATMIEAVESKISRYSYIKNIEFCGKKYEVEIDELKRCFWLIEM